MIGWKSQRKRLFHWKAELEKVGIHLSMQKLRAKFCQKASREKCALCPPKKHKSRRKVDHTKMCARRKLQKTTLSMVKSRLALMIGGCLFVSLSPCQKWPNTQNNGCWLPTSIGETLFQTRKEELLVQPVFCIVTGSCFQGVFLLLQSRHKVGYSYNRIHNPLFHCGFIRIWAYTSA